MNELDFTTQLSNKGMKRETIDQLTKDCFLVGVELALNPEGDTESQLELFERVLRDLDRNQPGKIEQLSYRINFPEKVFQKLKSDPKINFYTELAYEFMLFELKKVISRKKFKL